MHPDVGMTLSIPTLYVVFVINCLALGLVWTYVARCYPNFETARYWCAATFAAAAGAAMLFLRDLTDPYLPILFGNGLLAARLLPRRHGNQALLRQAGQLAGDLLNHRRHSHRARAVWAMGPQDASHRVVIFSIGQVIPAFIALRDMTSRKTEEINPGARLAIAITMLIIVAHTARSVAALLQTSGVPLEGYRTFQASLIVLLVFLITAWNFAFLLMAIDRLRAEVTELAMHDDLTGVANRRQLFSRLSSECLRSQRSSEPFTLLAIDLDGFKSINDNFGHAAGDHCLRVVADKMKARLRSTDLLARVGGDEFFVLMPATNLEEGGRVAQDLLDICQRNQVNWTGKSIVLAASIGVAQWSQAPHMTPEHLMVAADQALYAAKEQGKGRYTMAPITLAQAHARKIRLASLVVIHVVRASTSEGVKARGRAWSVATEYPQPRAPILSSSNSAVPPRSRSSRTSAQGLLASSRARRMPHASVP